MFSVTTLKIGDSNPKSHLVTSNDAMDPNFTVKDSFMFTFLFNIAKLLILEKKLNYHN